MMDNRPWTPSDFQLELERLGYTTIDVTVNLQTIRLRLAPLYERYYDARYAHINRYRDDPSDEPYNRRVLAYLLDERLRATIDLIDAFRGLT
jgi:hypothetical protein